MRTSYLLAFCLSLVLPVQVAQSANAPFILGLGGLNPSGSQFSEGASISADGSVVTGYSGSPIGTQAFGWSNGTMVGLGVLPGGSSTQGSGVSGDGRTIVGLASGPTISQAFRWHDGQMVGLGDLPGGIASSWAVAASFDGSIIAGQAHSAQGSEAFIWTASDGMKGLGDLSGGAFRSYATDISNDGRYVVGNGESDLGREAFIWSAESGLKGLGDLPGGLYYSVATAVSANGQYVVGFAKSKDIGWEAFRWSQEDGMVGLGDLPGGSFNSAAWAISGDGSVIVGDGYTDEGLETFIWFANRGMIPLETYLIQEVGLDLSGWDLLRVRGISDDGLTLVGTGDGPMGRVAWVAHVPEPSSILISSMIALAVLRRREA